MPIQNSQEVKTTKITLFIFFCNYVLIELAILKMWHMCLGNELLT